jgi:hypothetical protein
MEENKPVSPKLIAELTNLKNSVDIPWLLKKYEELNR